MTVWFRLLLYVVVMFLIMVVYTGQQHEDDDAKAILRDSARKTVKFVVWTIIAVLVMELCFWSFID